ncbi:glycosyltransferase [Neptunomonas sp.]|uniref:glycosyltransferase family 2 protein n=1 Tax=Neptunomonas sp. TaxID=1971898 RepID=UPI0025D80161|nr:glycosyltransferase [Neptunomonas sp.]
MQTPLVSVVVRTKDRLGSLANCIESIVEQDYRPIHVVVVNDGGECVQNVLSLYGDELLTVTLLDLAENVGRTCAANLGLDAVRGEYVSFLDDDDYWLPSHLSSLVSGLLDSKLDSESGLPEVAIYSATRAVLIEKNAEKEIKIYQTDFDKARLLYNNFLPIHSVLFSRVVLGRGARFDESFDLFEDWDFWLQVSSLIPFIYLPKITCVYRLHSDASGVHGEGLTTIAYQKIYEKWLANCSCSELSELFQKTHAWCSEGVENLQNVHQEKLNTIGGLHTHAISVIAEKDANIASLNKIYSNAISVIEEKDADIASLGGIHSNALSVIEEKDENIRTLEEAHRYAVSVVKERDITLAAQRVDIDSLRAQLGEIDDEAQRVKIDLSNALSVIDDRDIEAARLEEKGVAQVTEIANLKAQLVAPIIKRSWLVLQGVFGRRNK